MNKRAALYLEDGSIFYGWSFGADNECVGEVVFNTGMTGYQEILTDPSYKGQIVTLTYPQIGNYGINKYDMESDTIYVEGLVVREYIENYSNFRADRNLSKFLSEKGKIGITGIDTRKLTKILREKGSMVGIISGKYDDLNYLNGKIREFGSIVGKNLVESLGERSFSCLLDELYRGTKIDDLVAEGVYKRVAILDYGCKFNIIREIVKRGAYVKIFNLKSDIEEIRKFNPNGILVSNGPGDPVAVKQAIDLLKILKDEYPIFGICLGHQLIGLSTGAKIIKLKYGHHGLNHPVKRLSDGKIEITSQNHNFAIDADSINNNEIEVTHINLNDMTVEGMKFKNLPIFSVQYHPEAAPGPNDSKYLFDDFFKLMS